MSPNDPKKVSPWQVAFSSKALVVGGEVGCLTLVIVLGSIFGGLWLDNLLGTKPLITIILVLASAPFSIALTFWLARRAITDMSEEPSAETKTSSNNIEGETTGE